MRFSSQLSRNSTWTIGEQQKAGMVEKTACLWADSWLSVRLSETDLEDEGCGEVHCEGEEQREYIPPYTSSSYSVFLPFGFFFLYFFLLSLSSFASTLFCFFVFFTQSSFVMSKGVQVAHQNQRHIHQTTTDCGFRCSIFLPGATAKPQETARGLR